MLKYILLSESIGDPNDVFEYKEDTAKHPNYKKFIILSPQRNNVYLSLTDSEAGLIFATGADETMNLTHGTPYKDVVKLFNTIYKILRDNLTIIKYRGRLQFSADTSEPSRVRIYDTFSKMLANKFDAKYQRIEMEHSILYYVIWDS